MVDMSISYGIPHAADNAATPDGYFAYTTTLHEAVHAPGLSNTAANLVSTQQPYEAAHPTIADAVMNHDGEVGGTTQTLVRLHGQEGRYGGSYPLSGVIRPATDRDIWCIFGVQQSDLITNANWVHGTSSYVSR